METGVETGLDTKETEPLSEWESAGNYIKISEDSMQAFLYLMPKQSGAEYTRDELRQQLMQEGIVGSFHESNLAAMAKKGVYGREVLVAEGTPIVAGADGYYDYKIEMDDFRKHPRVRPDGSVDYQSMSLLQNVEKGQVLAIYHHAVQGQDGQDVYGRTLSTPHYKELPAIKGRGIELLPDSEEEPTYVAQSEGKIVFRDGHPEICNVHEVNGDVDAIIGRVEFFGDIVINGNVSYGVVIKAGKSLTINGTVEAADIYAGGDIIFKYGVQGNEKALIRSRGTVYADFLEHCKVEAKGDVCANYILNCDISAEGIVHATGKKGMLLGGYIHGFQGIKAMVVGNNKEVKTVLHAGCEPSVYERNTSNRKEEAEIMEQLEFMEERAEDLKKQLVIRSKDVSLVRECEKLIEQRDKLVERAKDLQSEKQMLQKQMEEGRQASIRVEDKLYAGSVISVNNAQQSITANTSFMQYKCISGIIQGTVIRI